MKKNKIYGIRICISIISIIITIVLAINPPNRSGLENIWVLPLVYFLIINIFKNIFYYQKDGVAIKICIIIETIRFLLLPLLISISNGEISNTRMCFVEAEYYIQAIIIQCIELIIFFGGIHIFYGVYEKKITIKEEEGGLSFSGLVLFGIFIAGLLLRINVWLPALKIFGIKESSSNTPILLEKTLFSCCNIIILSFLITKTRKYKYKTKKYYIGLFFTMIYAVFNSLSYFGTNRVYVIENIISSFLIIIYAFPNNKKMIKMVIIPITSVLVFSMIVTKQFGLKTSTELKKENITIKYLSNTIEEYVNGPWCIAQTLKSSKNKNLSQRFQAFAKDITNGLYGIGDLPVIKNIIQYTNEWKSSSEIMKMSFEKYDRGQMLSFSGNMFIWMGDFGWFGVILINSLILILLLIIDIKVKKFQSVYYKYIYIWMGILFGLTHCYCIETILYCWNKLALIYLIFLKCNTLELKKGE